MASERQDQLERIMSSGESKSLLYVYDRKGAGGGGWGVVVCVCAGGLCRIHG